jgi:tetratricopeptide (TPR) repeat protein
MVSGSKDPEDKKMILLFDHLSGLESFEGEDASIKIAAIKSHQMSNLKAYLFEKILMILRMYHASKVKDVLIRNQIDYAQILLERRLYPAAIKCLEKAKKMAKQNFNLELQLEVLKLEKSMVMQNLSNSTDLVKELVDEVKQLSTQISNINTFNNLSVQLNVMYTRVGFIRDESEYAQLQEFFTRNIGLYRENELSLIEKLNLYRLLVGYYFFMQDFENGHESSQKLVELFNHADSLIEHLPDDYIKALNNLLIAQYKLFRYYEFVETNQVLQKVAQNPNIRVSESIRIRLLKYYFTHEINKYFMTGEFDKGVETIINQQGQNVQQLISMLDQHSALVLNYKIACLYFGAGNFGMAAKSLNKIIAYTSTDLREDLHCFARIMNLVCHYELNNFDVINHYIVSTYRFLLKKEDLRMFQKVVLKFLKSLPPDKKDDKNLINKFEQLRIQLIQLTDSSYEKRAFIYFDIISWLESKIERLPVQEIIKRKFSQRVAQKGLSKAT